MKRFALVLMSAVLWAACHNDPPPQQGQVIVTRPVEAQAAVDPPTYAENIQVGSTYNPGIAVQVAPPFLCNATPICIFGTAVPSYPEWVPGMGWVCRPGYCDRVHVGVVFHSGYYDTYNHVYVRPYWEDRPSTTVHKTVINNYGNQGPAPDTNRVADPYTYKAGPDIGRNSSGYIQPRVVEEPKKSYEPVSGTVQIKTDAKTSYLKTYGEGNKGIVSNNLTGPSKPAEVKSAAYVPQAITRTDPPSAPKAFVPQAVTRTPVSPLTGPVLQQKPYIPQAITRAPQVPAVPQSQRPTYVPQAITRTPAPVPQAARPTYVPQAVTRSVPQPAARSTPSSTPTQYRPTSITRSK